MAKIFVVVGIVEACQIINRNQPLFDHVHTSSAIEYDFNSKKIHYSRHSVSFKEHVLHVTVILT